MATYIKVAYLQYLPGCIAEAQLLMMTNEIMVGGLTSRSRDEITASLTDISSSST
jgi:hypothetical protein